MTGEQRPVGERPTIDASGPRNEEIGDREIERRAEALRRQGWTRRAEKRPRRIRPDGCAIPA